MMRNIATSMLQRWEGAGFDVDTVDGNGFTDLHGVECCEDECDLDDGT